MEVVLVNTPTLEFIDMAIGECYDKGCYTDEAKQIARINRVANVSKHSSVLEFGEVIYEVTASTKVLLEMTRHRLASYACKSSRYTLNKGEVVFESTGDSDVDRLLLDWKYTVESMIAEGKTNDVVSLMLPQAYQYRWLVSFNLRSLQNFLVLRLNKHAHFQIRKVAEEMYNTLPTHIKEIVND